MITRLLLVVLLIVNGLKGFEQELSSSSLSMSGNHGKNCEPITMSICQGLEYNKTTYPNLLGHQTQSEAFPAITQFNPLIKVKCSEDIRLFLCTVYAPVCTVLEQPIQPCRELCLSAKNGCESLMKKFGFQWPDQLECSKFPLASNNLCVGKNKTSSGSTGGSGGHGFRGDMISLGDVSPFERVNKYECPHTLHSTTGSHFSLQLFTGVVPECSLPCDADNKVPMLLTARVRRLVRFWTGAWSVACCVCAFFTIVTFMVDLQRFAYPVRPILYLAMCYMAISIVYMIGVVGEDRFACGSYGSTPAELVTQGVENVGCSALAVTHYYFFIASSIWWLVLCLAWFLAANLKWGAESISALAAYFHAMAWGVPALLSVAVLVTNSVDGDVFTGVCSVGNLQPSALFYFLFLPTVVCLGIGLLFLVCGIWSMLRIRSYIKLQHADVERNISKLEKLMFRISAFAVMYALPTAANAAILCYQSMHMPSWIEGWLHLRCMRADRAEFGYTQSETTCPPYPNTRQPEVAIFLMKYFSQLIVGITCAIWVCSSKTVGSYQRAYARLAMTSRQ